MDMGFSDSRAVDANAPARRWQPLEWHALCARLVAAQDLRRERADRGHPAAPVAGAGAAVGSFHAQAAGMLARLPDPQDCVNPTSSANGKGIQGTSVDSGECPLIERAMRQADENRHD